MRITISDAAELLGVNAVTIRRMVARGELPAYRIGSTALLRVEKSDVDALLKRVQ